MRVIRRVRLAALALLVGVFTLAAVTPVKADSEVLYYSTTKNRCVTGTENLQTNEAKNSQSYKSAAECYASLAGNGSGHTDNLMGTLQTVLNVVFGVIGFIAVVMLVYGGIQYTISSGDASKVKKAKDTILYGIVGLIIALLAAAIVNFVLVNIK